MIFRSLIIACLVVATLGCRDEARPNPSIGFAGGQRRISGTDYYFLISKSDDKPTHLVLIPKATHLSGRFSKTAEGEVVAELSVKDEHGKATERTYALRAPISLIESNLALTTVKLTAVNGTGSEAGTVKDFYSEPRIEWQVIRFGAKRAGQ